MLMLWKPEAKPERNSEVILNGIAAISILCGDTLVVVSAHHHEVRRSEQNESSLPQAPSGSKGVTVEPWPRIESLVFTGDLPASPLRRSQETCVICLQDFVLGDAQSQLGCGHVFHPPCLERWMPCHHSQPWCPFRCDAHAQANSNGESARDPTKVTL
eukprot:3243488-Amphidinium_carterae.1